ncbi:MAG: sulfurtransferase [Anaerolineae bacterium]|nr:sulfurtransferase [Anaerolineae bacterium]MDW8101005.1 sulfurtransferase [Anaerolineae bacterium]
MKFSRIWLLIVAVLLTACAVPVTPAAVEQAPANPAVAEKTSVTTDIAQPEVLVDTNWVAENLHKEGIRLVDVSSKPEVYAEGHIPGAVYVNWQTDLTNPDDPVKGQILTAQQLEALLGRLGIDNQTTVVFYDDSNSLFATRAFWVLKYYGHQDVRVLDGGRKKWVAEGRELSQEVPNVTPTTYKAGEPNLAIRATWEQVLASLKQPDKVILDARSPKEYTGQDVRSARGGHIPGAINLEWTSQMNPDGTFKPVAELRKLYEQVGVQPDQQVFTYCQTGVRGAHSWFVLTQLLGFENVVNYDGSWEEWGNRTDLPIER